MRGDLTEREIRPAITRLNRLEIPKEDIAKSRVLRRREVAIGSKRRVRPNSRIIKGCNRRFQSN